MTSSRGIARWSRRGRGVTLFEFLLAIIFLMTSLVFLFGVFSSSGKDTVFAYHETIAYELAQEGIELVAGLGYSPLKRATQTGDRSLAALIGNGGWESVIDLPTDDSSMIQYPEDFKRFKRKIEVIDKGPGLLLVRVRVTADRSIFRRDEVVIEKLVGIEHD